MKLTEDFIVLRDRKTGNFLRKIETGDGYLKLNYTFVDDVRFAKVIPYSAYLENKVDVKSLAKLSESEIVRVKAEYTLTYPSGADVPEIINQEHKGPSFEDFLEALLK